MDADFPSFISRCIAGKAPSWEAFFSECGAIDNQLLKNRFPSFSIHEIEDSIQIAFAKLALSGLKTFRGAIPYNFHAYFKTITLNEAKYHLSTRVKRQIK